MDEKIKEFLNIDNRLHFDPKVAEEIKRFAGDDRVAVVMGSAHFMGSHNNVAISLGLGNSLIINSRYEGSFFGHTLSSVLPYKACDAPNQCRLNPPSGGRYDIRKVEQYAMGTHETKPYKRMDYAGISVPEDRTRLETVEAIYDSAQLPVRKPDQIGPN